nr:hypothetical protein [Pseudomonas sp. LPH1]
MKQTCILVLGMHRSGTSALSGAMSILDVYLGSQLMKPLDQNPKGFYENILLYKINERILKEIGSGWDDVFFKEEKLSSIKCVDELTQVLKEEFQDSPLFAIKDPRLAYLFPLYIQALSNLGVAVKVVVPFRNPVEVAGSLSRRNGFSQEKGLLLWAYHFLLSEKLSRDFPRVFTQFDELIQSPKEVFELIDSKLDLNIASRFELKKDELQEFLTPDLKHHNVSLESFSENVPGIIREIVDQVSHLNEVDSTEKLDSLRNQLFENQSLFYNADIRSAIGELAHAKQGLQAKDQELTQAKQGLQAKDQELTQAKQGLQAKDQELTQAKQGLQAKDQELTQTKQGLEHKDQELARARQELQAQDQELTQTKQELQVKDQELARARQGLQAKDRELAQVKQGLQAKKQELVQVEHELNSKERELKALTYELISIHMSNSWKLTRPFRQLKRMLRSK